MRLLPMNDGSAGEAVTGTPRLRYAEALVSPCATCATSPCCSYLPLHTFKVTTMLELDHAIYLLNFDRIELGLSAAGQWSVYYRYPCRFLDRQTFGCTVHDTPQQPNICVHYNPYGCWYKRVLTPTVGDEFLRIDRRRMQFILDHTLFAEDRTIVEVPTWEALVDEFSQRPPRPNDHFDPPPAADPVFDAWEGFLRDGVEAAEADGSAELHGHTALPVRDPCQGCQAYCCTTLVFPHAAPTTMSSLDYFKFCLGFPGIELGITDDSWMLVVKTTCRHLQGQRCGVYGQPERPLLCRYYDAWKCTYRPQFGQPRPADFLRVRLEQYEWLAECFVFDQYGTVVQRPLTAALREHIEACWRRRLMPTSAQPVRAGVPG